MLICRGFPKAGSELPQVPKDAIYSAGCIFFVCLFCGGVCEHQHQNKQCQNKQKNHYLFQIHILHTHVEFITYREFKSMKDKWINIKV